MFKEFKYALLFLGKFLAVYFVGNILYGLYIEAFGQSADSLTYWVTEQSAIVLRFFGFDVVAAAHNSLPTIGLVLDGDPTINVFEGCNGLNVIIIFVAFVVSYSGPLKNILFFIPLGIIGIHLFNISRIVLLFFVAEKFPSYMYYAHKYVFTAVIYLFVFGLWYWWVSRFSRIERSKKVQTS